MNVLLTGVVTLAWGVPGAAALGLVECLFVLAWVVGGFKIKRVGGETLLPSESSSDAHGHSHHDAHAAAAAH